MGRAIGLRVASYLQDEGACRYGWLRMRRGPSSSSAGVHNIITKPNAPPRPPTLLWSSFLFVVPRFGETTSSTDRARTFMCVRGVSHVNTHSLRKRNPSQDGKEKDVSAVSLCLVFRAVSVSVSACLNHLFFFFSPREEVTTSVLHVQTCRLFFCVARYPTAPPRCVEQKIPLFSIFVFTNGTKPRTDTIYQ